MPQRDQEMVTKIKNILVHAQDKGIPYQVAAAYITGDIKGYSRTSVRDKDLLNERKILNKLFFEESVTIPMIKQFIKSKNIDMNEFIEELKTENIVLHDREGDEAEDMKIDKFIEDDEELFEDIEEPEKFEEEFEEEHDGDEYDKIFEEIDEYAEPQETEQNKKPQTKKAADLESKIADLYDKIAKEENLFKRHINQFKIRGLIAKLQREIDRQNLKEKYDLKRKRMAREKNRKEEDLLVKTTDMQEEIDNLKKILKGNQEYDYKSKSFMYPKDYVEKVGGIENLTEKLKGIDKEATQNAAKKMEQMVETRRQLSEMKEKLKAEQEKLSNLDVEYYNKEKRLKKKEKSLALVNNNPLNKLKGWFSNAFAEINAYLADRKDYKALKAEEKEEMQVMEEEYKKMRKEMQEAIKRETAEKQAKMKNDKLREFQENSGIKVSKDQLIESDAPEQQSEPVNDLENDDIQNDQDNHEEPEGEEH